MYDPQYMVPIVFLLAAIISFIVHGRDYLSLEDEPENPHAKFWNGDK